MIHLFLISLIIAPQLWLDPFVGLRVDYYIYPVWIAAAVVSGRLFRTPWTLFDTFFVVFLLVMLSSAIVNGFGDIQEQYLINYTKWFVLCRLTLASISSFRKFNQITTSLTILVLILAVEVIQHKLGPSGIGWAGQTLDWVDKGVLEAGGTGRARWVGIFDGPGVFSVIFTVVLPFILMRLHKPFTTSTRLIFLFLSVMMCVAIYFIGSRGGLLASLGIVALHVALRQEGGVLQFKKWLFVIIPLCVIAIAAAPDYLTDLDDDSGSAEHRVDMWAEGLEMVEQNPVFGIGRGNFKGYAGRMVAHNSAVEIMGELGVIGLFLWVSLIGMSFRSVYEAAIAEEDDQDLLRIRAIGLSLFGYLVCAMFVTLEYETFYVLLALCIGVGNCKNVSIIFDRKLFLWVCAIMMIFYLTLKVFVISYFILIN